MKAIHEAVLHERVRQLEQINAQLAAQVNRQGRVVDEVVQWATWLRVRAEWAEPEAALEHAVRLYQREMVGLGKGGR